MSIDVQTDEPPLLGWLVKGPVGFRQLLQRLGPTFIKVGQFLAMRPDLIPQRYSDELLRLLDRVPPFPWEQARAILAEDLDADPAEVFDYINPTPVAAGSLAQTHYARLHDGAEVAIKILRPGIKEMVSSDLRRARLMARLLDLSGATLIIDPQEVVRELTLWMEKEVDFKLELANLTRLHRLTAKSALEKVPRPYPDLSGPRVVTSEYLRGIPVSELVIPLRSGRRREVERITSLGIDRDQFAENLLNAALRQIFRYQFFHADLHPGNLIALPDNVVGFVDFGLCDVLDEEIRESQMRYLMAVYDGEPEEIYRVTMELLKTDDRSDVVGFRTEFLAQTREWIDHRSNDGESADAAQAEGGSRSPLAQWMVGVMRTAHVHRLKVPTKILSMYRALLTAEMVADQLRARADLGAVGRRFFERLRFDEMIRKFDPDNLQPNLLNAITLLRNSPGQLYQLLSQLADGQLVLNARTTRATKERRARYRRARLLSTSLFSLAVAIALAIPQFPKLSGFPLKWLLLDALAFLYLWTYTQWRRLR